MCCSPLIFLNDINALIFTDFYLFKIGVLTPSVTQIWATSQMWMSTGLQPPQPPPLQGMKIT